MSMSPERDAEVAQVRLGGQHPLTRGELIEARHLIDDVEIAYEHHGDILTEREALDYLVATTGRTRAVEVLASIGKKRPYYRYFRARVGVSQAKPCTILCTPGVLNAEEAEAVSVLLVTARLIALTVDGRRERARAASSAEARVP